MKLLSPAKVNVFLEIQGKRSDGYHQIETLMVGIDLFDHMTIERAEETKVRISGRDDVPEGRENLAYRALRLLREYAEVNRNASIQIQKQIPPGSGLGGGSSNAAMTLLGLNKLWNLNLPVKQLEEVGKTIGSDVNFFLHPSAAICRGRGEQVQVLREDTNLHILLLIPRTQAETPRVYEEFDRLHPEGPEEQFFVDTPEVNVSENTNFLLFNHLQEAAFSLYPELRELHSTLQNRIDLPLMVSGSGSTLFCVSSRPKEIQQVQRQINNHRGELPGSFRLESVRTLSRDWTPFQN